MTVVLAYLSVVLIWATTPLAIQWSSHSLTFIAAVCARMSLALALALVIHGLLRQSLMTYWQQRKVFFAASLGLFPNMPLVYWAAQFIPSGLVAVIFALMPFATALMTLLLLGQNPFSLKRVVALLLAILGVAVIFYQQFHLDLHSAWGVAGILLSCVLFSFSSVWVKKLHAQTLHTVTPFEQATGALLFALPGLLLTWWWMDGELPLSVSQKSLGAVVYLAVIGSLLGAVLFFFILQRLSATSVSLITLMTPVLAILIGWLWADENLSGHTLVGVSIVLAGLLLYMPWSLAARRAALALWLKKCLQTPSVTAQPTHQSVREKAQHDWLRYK